MRNTGFSRWLAAALALCLLLSLLPALRLTAFAEEAEMIDPGDWINAPALPDKNDEVRHQVCTALSDQALAYYTGDNTYEALSLLPGAAENDDSWEACQDNQLYNALQSLMASTHTYQTSYSGISAGSLAYYWARTDSVSGSDTYVMFYCDEDGSIGSMQREHIWPKSRASYYQKNGGSDLHHLRPSYGSLNQAKSNHRFGNIVGVYADYTRGMVNGKECYWVYGAGDLFECKDDVKGDVARILLYVYTRWGQPNLYSEVSEDYLPTMDSDDSQNTGLPAVESLETLLQWCEQDPVDTWEMERNDLIQQVQGNRNVFIDYPELAWLMFGEAIPAGIQTPTHEGCQHEWSETGSTQPTCVLEGTVTFTCSKCGAIRTEVIPALGHIDENNDDVCDRCGAEMAAFRLSTALPSGAQAVIYYPAGQTVLSLETTSYPRVKPQSGMPEGDRFDPVEGMAVFDVIYLEGDETNFYLHCASGYLTTIQAGNALSYQAEPNDYSLWHLAPAESENCVYVYSTNATYDGENYNQALEFYSGGFTVYRLTETSNKTIYTFQLFVHAPAGHTHTWVLTETVAPTCTEGGYELWTCTGCGETKRENETAALGHDYGSAVMEPTCTEGGYTIWTCLRCGDSYADDETAPLGHDYGSAVTAPTCTEGGYTIWTCSRCGDSYVDDETAPLGHDWDEGQVTLEPTEDQEGERTFTCLRCGQTRTEAIPALEPFRFDDVRDPAKFYYDAVYWAVNQNPAVTNGTSENLFSPNNSCTRGQVVTFLWRAAGCPEPTITTCSFTDVKPGAYYYTAMLWALETNITQGASEDRFAPNQPCTRAQTVTFLWRAAGSPEPTLTECPFTDVKPTAYFRDATLWALEHEITNGTTNTTFSPNKVCNRGQVVTFLYRSRQSE